MYIFEEKKFFHIFYICEKIKILFEHFILGKFWFLRPTLAAIYQFSVLWDHFIFFLIWPNLGSKPL